MSNCCSLQVINIIILFLLLVILIVVFYFDSSDGAGRTGTYCLIDMVLNRMIKGAKEIDIAAALEHIRDQRPDMVSTKKQFEFVLVAVAEEVHAILKALPTQINDKNSPLAQTSISSNSDK